jgi:FkbM family methyltransferase
MSFVSYAQNFEDVMLWRALKHVEHGFYIDVGAAWPAEHSVTKAFYERGWRGINIEPNPEFNKQLQEHRPRDKNLRLAVGDSEGILDMNFLENTGLSTLDDAIAQTHVHAGWRVSRQQVQVTTLSSIWQQFVPTGQDVHFLKIDVEGLEGAVLRGTDWSRCRPWIVVVEATLPLSQVESHESWEAILFAASYRFAYADGLNRFYVADEHAELLSAFKYPPNVFDDFWLSREQDAEARATQAEVRVAQADALAIQAQSQFAQAEARAAQADALAIQAQSQSAQAEARAAQAEARVAQADALAIQAQSQSAQAEARAAQAEARVAQADALAIQAQSQFAQAEARAAQAEARVAQADALAIHAQSQFAQAEARAAQAEARITDLLNSTSWRVTAPLRLAASAVRGINPNCFKRRAKLFLQHAALYVGRRPRLKKTVLIGLEHFPSLKLRLFRVVTGAGPQPFEPQNVRADVAHLSPRARQIHADLKIAIERYQKGNR